MDKTAVLLINVGSPDKPELWPVWRYLTSFLNDKYVIDLPWLLRKFLVNFIIIPLRVRHSTGLYRQLWTEKGSPLIWHSLAMKVKLQKKAGEDYKIFVGMRYGNPGYKSALDEIEKDGYEKLIIFPLFPQYATATSGTAIEAIQKEIKKRDMRIDTRTVDQFYDHPEFVKAFTARIREYNPDTFDHIVFSYHGLPNRQLEKIHPGIRVEDCRCENSVPEFGHKCYRAACYATTRLIAKDLKLRAGDYSIAFQSRLSKNWMEPFTDDVLLQKLKEGKKRILIAVPSFVTDCLETNIEIGYEYRKMFREAGGEELQLTESLNSEDKWIEALESMIIATKQKFSTKQE